MKIPSLLSLLAGIAATVALVVVLTPDLPVEEWPPRSVFSAAPSRTSEAAPLATTVSPISLPAERPTTLTATPIPQMIQTGTPSVTASIVASQPSPAPPTVVPASLSPSVLRASTLASSVTANNQAEPPPGLDSSGERMIVDAFGGGIVVPLGRSLPASLSDAGKGATSAQIEALDRIADDFARDVTAESAPETQETKPRQSPPRPSDWNPAIRAANERYRQIFGVELYNAWTTQAAKDALEEKRRALGR